MGKAELLILTQPRDQSKQHFHVSVPVQDYFLCTEAFFFFSKIFIGSLVEDGQEVVVKD